MNDRTVLALALCALRWPCMAGDIAEMQVPKLRLPTNVQPVHYVADLHVTPGEDHFRGSIEIELNVLEATPVIWLHAKSLEFHESSIRSGHSERPVRIQSASKDFAAVTADGGLAPGRVLLRISYIGELSRKLTDGAFQQREGSGMPGATPRQPTFY